MMPIPLTLTRQYLDCFRSRSGQKVLAHLCRNFGGFYQSTHVAGDPYSSAYLAGQRDVIVAILRRLGEPETKLPDTTIDAPRSDVNA